MLRTATLMLKRLTLIREITLMLKLIDSVFIDDKELSKENYDTEEGSLILMIHPDYLKSLDLGTHNIMLRFKSESSDAFDLSTNLTVAKAKDQPIVPNTGTNTNYKKYEANIDMIGYIGSVVIITFIVGSLTHPIRREPLDL